MSLPLKLSPLPALVGAAVLGGVASLLLLNRDHDDRDLYMSGMRAIESGALDDAERALLQLQGQPDREIDAAILCAALQLRRDQPELALQTLNGIVAKGAHRQPVLRVRGEALYRLGELARAEAVFLKLAQLQPQNPEPHRWLGAIYYDLGAMRPAIDELNVVARLEPQDYRPFRLIALIQKDSEQFIEAAAAYQDALERSPPADVRAEIALEFAEVLSKQFEHDRALEVLADAAPTPESLALRAKCLWSLGRTDEALRALSEGRRIDSDHPALDIVDAQLKLDAGEAEAAIIVLESILAHDPHDFRARYQIAQAWRQAGDQERHDLAMQQMTASRQLYYRLAELNELAVAQPDDPAIREELADICRKLNRPELAEMWDRAARALHSDHTSDE